MTDNKQTDEQGILTSRELARVGGDRDACLAVIAGLGDCTSCIMPCKAIAIAQDRATRDHLAKENGFTREAKAVEQVRKEERADVLSMIEPHLKTLGMDKATWYLKLKGRE